MTDRFQTDAELFEAATTPEDRRAAARYWLTDAIQWAQAEGKAVSPAMALLEALEGLDFGRVYPMLRLPAGQKRGGKEAPPAETGLKATALASIEKLVSFGFTVSSAVQMVAEEFGMKPGALENLRKKVSMERSKPQAKRSRYLNLIKDFEQEMAAMSDKSKDDVLFGLARISRMMGLNSSLDSIP